jgi:hypothetical protein
MSTEKKPKRQTKNWRNFVEIETPSIRKIQETVGIRPLPRMRKEPLCLRESTVSAGKTLTGTRRRDRGNRDAHGLFARRRMGAGTGAFPQTSGICSKRNRQADLRSLTSLYSGSERLA